MRSPAVAVFLGVLFPSLVLASSLDDVVNDAASFDGVLQQMQDEQSGQAADQLREAGSEVFPVTGQGSSASRQNVADEDPVFLTARVDGVPVVFRDVPKDVWFAPYVRSVTGQGIVSGYREADGTLKGLFGPADSLTIEQLAKIAVQVAQVDLSACGSAVKNTTAQETW
ncbi:MAG: S-layer homology domain-containing protein, partial [Candidatus Peregrinibacteria bacterium]